MQENDEILAWSRLKAERFTMLEAAKTLALARGFEISDEVHAETGSSYFTATKHINGAPAGFRIRISNHRPNGAQVRAHTAFVTYHCVKRGRRDLKRLIRRLDRLEEFNAS